MRRVPLLLLLASIVLATLAGSVSAAPSATSPAVAPTTAIGAVAIGQLVSDEGPPSTLDLRAGTRAGHTLGTLRFFCPMFGYYNGVVRSLTVENGVISVSGGGVLVKPDDTRQVVRFSATITIDARTVVFEANGIDLHYQRSGLLDPGHVRVHQP